MIIQLGNFGGGGGGSVDPSVLSGYCNGGQYNASTQKIELLHDSNVIARIDASAFVIDGMVEDAYLSGTTLVIEFNTAAGKQDIEVPLSSIFNPSNYYTKSEVDTELAKKQPVSAMTAYTTNHDFAQHSGNTTMHTTAAEKAAWNAKVDASALATVNNALTAHTADTSIHVSLNEKAAWNAKANIVELTQEQYNSLATKDPDVLYIITDAQAINMNDYWTSAQTQSAISGAVLTKQDTLVSGQNIKTINNQSLLGSGNIDIQGGGSDIPLAEVSGNKYVSGGNYTLQDELEGGIRGFAISTTDTEQGASRQWYLTELQYDGQLYRVDRIVDSGGTVLRSDESRYMTQNDFDESVAYSVAYKVNLNQLDEGDGSIIDYALQNASPSIIGVVMNEDDDEIKKWYPCSASIDEQALYVYTESNIIKYTLRVDEGTGDFVADKEVLPYGSSYYYTSAQTDTLLASKQDTLVSGTNIKTINNQSLLGSGNIDIQGGGATYSAGTNISINTANTISCTLPITAGTGNTASYVFGNSLTDTGSGNIVIGNKGSVSGTRNVLLSVNPGSAFGSSIAGNGSIVIGGECISNNDNGIAIGAYNTRSYNAGYAIGYEAIASGTSAVAIGNNATAKGTSVIAIGNWVSATGTTKMNLNNQIKVDTNNQVYISNSANTSTYCVQEKIETTEAALGGLSFVRCTQAQYDALVTKDADTMYIIVSGS